MAKILVAAVIAGAMLFGAAQAAPGFGASSHRLSGSTPTQSAPADEPATFVEAFLALLGIESTRKIDPTYAEKIAERMGAANSESRSKAEAEQCDEAKKAEDLKSQKAEARAKAKRSDTAGRPVYLAF